MENPTSDHQSPDISSIPPSIVGEPEKTTPEHQTPDIASVPPFELEKPTSEHQTPDISSVPPSIDRELEKPTSDHQTPDLSSVPPSIDGEIRLDPAVVTEVLEQQHPEAEQKTEMSEEEVKSTLEKIASTGKFCQDWEKLKVALSCWLKKTLSEYPEAEMTDELQKEALGESYSRLVSRLDEALLSFNEGPPFTLQRICEILVAAKSIYPKLSKLAFALEKNLLVTSLLSISTEAETQVIEDAKAATETLLVRSLLSISTEAKTQVIEDAKAAIKDTKIEAATEVIKMAAGNEETEKEAGNVIEAMGGDTDEIMTDVVEEAEVDDAMTSDTETIVEPTEETMASKKSESETPSETS